MKYKADTDHISLLPHFSTIKVYSFFLTKYLISQSQWHP